MSWFTLGVLAAGSWLFKATGVFIGERAVRGRAAAVIALVPAALFTSLVSVQTFASGTSLVLDARAAGLLVAILAAWRRLPFVIVIVAAMAATAAVRALGLAA